MMRSTAGFFGVTILFLAAGCGSSGPGTYRGAPIVLPEGYTVAILDDQTPGHTWGVLQESVVAMEIARLELDATDAEVERASEARLNLPDFDGDLAEAILSQGRAMKEALLAWHAAPAESETIYETILAPHDVSPEAWRYMQETYNTAESAEQYNVPQDRAGLIDRNKLQVRKELLRQKLAEHIDGEPITASGPRWDSFTRNYDAEELQAARGGVEMMFKNRRADQILTDWIVQMLQEEELILSKHLADRVKVWVPPRS